MPSAAERVARAGERVRSAWAVAEQTSRKCDSWADVIAPSFGLRELRSCSHPIVLVLGMHLVHIELAPYQLLKLLTI